MNPISNTAFYCCGIRMLDALRRRPICGDTYARQFMDERAMEIFRRFGGESGPNASNIARHRYIDDFLRQQLARTPQLQIGLIGCGFDSRAFRLTGGRWFELDEPPLIAYKEERLPAAQAPNPLRRIAIDFAADSLEERLRPLSPEAPTVFVIEGVTMYLPPQSLRATIEVLKSRFPGHRIIADLMTRSFIERLKFEGLDAVETRHPSHDGELRSRLTDIALRLGLLRTGGSDWHGDPEPGATHGALGSQEVPLEWLERLEQVRAARPAAAVG